jgi:hypothetical protein
MLAIVRRPQRSIWFADSLDFRLLLKNSRPAARYNKAAVAGSSRFRPGGRFNAKVIVR